MLKHMSLPKSLLCQWEMYTFICFYYILRKKHTRKTNRTNPKKIVKKKIIKIRAQNNEIEKKCTYMKPIFDSFNTLIILTNLWQY